MNRIRRLTLAGVATLPGALRAQGTDVPWPNRPVKIVVGFPPGQSSDIVGRTYAEELTKALGQPFLVENRPGAGATMAAAFAARAEPDGYTVHFGTSGNLAVAPNLYKNLTYDALKDFEFVVLVGRSPLVLVVRSDSKVTNLKELLERSKTQALNYGSGGNGVVNHLAMELVKKTSGAQLTHVPYKGSAPALNDLLGGAIDVMFDTSTVTLPLIKTGRLRPLAVTSATRMEQLPDVPAMAESLPGYEAVTWGMFTVPRGTPRPIVDRLAEKMVEIMRNPVVSEKLAVLGTFVTPDSTPAQARAWAVAEHAKWGRIIQDAGVKID
jgi:tripartite-type tricarboxylate transporter receptor subunit TctC